ncbi:MAG: FAD:protein FMN transferase [Verrucomicrobiota bacterium]
MTPPAALSSHEPDARGIRRVDFRALGTACTIQFRHPDARVALQFLADALGWLERFEAKFSRFQPTSMVSKINAAAGSEWVRVDAEMEHLLDLAAELFDITDGIVDPTVLPLLKLWDWKAVHTSLPEAASVRAALALTGFQKLQRKPGQVFLPLLGMGLDFGGFGKEFAVDQLVHLAHEHGIQDALIDLGRDIFGLGGNGHHPFWHVGLEDGRNPGTCWGGLAVSNFAVAASGDSARRFEHKGLRYGHILDPRSGWPVANGMRAVTVVAPTCLQAGIFSTALFVLGPKDGLRFASCARDLDACLQSDHGIETTRGFIRRQVQAA